MVSAPKALCACLMPKAECICDDEEDEPLRPVALVPAVDCRWCDTLLKRGPQGWRDADDETPAGYGCPDSPTGWHEAGGRRGWLTQP